MRLSLRSIGSTSPRFSFQSRISAASSGLIMIRASDPPMKSRRFGFIECGAVVKSLSLILIGVLVCLPRE